MMRVRPAIVLLSLMLSIPVAVLFQAESETRTAVALNVQSRKQEADQFLNQGYQQHRIGQFAAAIQSLKKALIIYQEIDNQEGAGLALNNIAESYNSLRQYDKALASHQQALIIFRQIGKKHRQGMTLNNMGGLYYNLGDYPNALESFHQALTIRREVRDYAGEATTLNNIGLVYDELGQYNQSLEFYQQALNINTGSAEIEDLIRRGRTLINIGLAHQNLAQSDEALTSAQSDEESKLAHYKEAFKSYQKALVIFRQVKDPAGEGTTLNNIGELYRDIKQYKKAVEFYQQALVIVKQFDPVGEARTLNNIGMTLRQQGQYREALESYQQALAIFRKQKDPSGEGATLNNVGSTLVAMGKFREAEQSLSDALKIWESLHSRLSDQNRISLFEKQKDTYRFLQSALVGQNKAELALEIAERGRSRALAELLSERLRSSNNKQSSLPPTISPNTSLKLSEIQRTAKEQNSTLVEYSFVPSEVKTSYGREWRTSILYAWIVQPSGRITLRKIDLTALDTAMGKLVADSRKRIGVSSSIYRQSITPADQPKNEQYEQAFRRLHEILIEPIADLLPKDPNQRVVFMPQDSLFYVPFAALQDKNGKYLIEKHTILTAPSIHTLQLTRETKLKQKTQSNETALIVGNPVMPRLRGEQMPSLSGAKKEAIAIANLFNTQPLIGKQATEAEVTKRMKTAKYIHLATHGLLDSINGDIPGAIALTPTPTDNGFLTASEIFDMQLNADLAVLSACDTALGDIKGEGVIGLSRSLISAGVPSVIVSLWQVPDAPTASLMTEFYRNLREKKLDKAQSLRQAMLTTKNRYPNPRNWAAFTLIGEAE